MSCLSLDHYINIIMNAMASQITSLTTVYSTVYSGADQRKYQNSESLALVWGIHRWPANSPHKWPVTGKNDSIWWRYHVNILLMFDSRDVINNSSALLSSWLMQCPHARIGHETLIFQSAPCKIQHKVNMGSLFYLPTWVQPALNLDRGEAIPSK